jgi:hypothetical protein
VGDVLANEDGQSTFRVRNKVFAGETLELLSPGGTISNITLPSPLTDSKGRQVEFANNEMIIRLDKKQPQYSILRRVPKQQP